MKKLRCLLWLAGISALLSGCKPSTQTADLKTRYPEWAKNGVIYEVNVRQHTPEGTFAALEKDLPRLKELGVDILWLMPVNPVGEKNRKGSLGSYYSVKNYKEVNPEFGSPEDFRKFIKAAQAQGFHILIDWVANHSAWDNPWVSEHPDWYKKDSTGKLLSPFDWTDVVALNYDNRELRAAMIDAMKYWVDSFNIDGFRCDVAGMVPVDFWEEARIALEKSKKLFMLAENEDVPALCDSAFDMNYGWQMHHLMHKVAKTEAPADTLWKTQLKLDTTLARDAIRMNFITNHDENSWNGTVKEKFGDAWQVYAAMIYTLPGMPLLYSGQEAGLDKRLKFFEKDTIDWTNKVPFAFYQTLNRIRHEEPLLWSPPYGGKFLPVKNLTEFPAYGGPESTWQKAAATTALSFQRSSGKDALLILLNPNAGSVALTFEDAGIAGTYTDLMSGKEIILEKEKSLSLDAYGFLILKRK